MKTSELQLGQIVRYKGNDGSFMDMRVVHVTEKGFNLSRPWIMHNGILCAEELWFDLNSPMEWELRP